MSPSFAFVAILAFQPALAIKACDATEYADDAQCLLQTDTTVKKRRAAARELLDEDYDQYSMKSVDMSEQNSVLDVDEQQLSKPSKKSAKSASSFLPRPNVGKGPDVITFGMMAKNFYGVNVKENDFTIDMVLTLMWEDKRTTKLIPKGAKNITLSQEEAGNKVWLPEIVVTNRDVDKYQIISTAVMLHEDGHVVKVQRLEVRVKDMYQLKQYPFDSQDLEVKIASSQYMSNAVKLQQSNDESYSGISDAPIFMKGTGFALKGWKIEAIEDNNGLLKKSRGVYTIDVHRTFGSYSSSHLVPSICVMLLACGVFFFPFIGPFVVPRLLMSVVAYLVFTNLKSKSEAALPGTAPNTWNDVFNTNVMLFMLIAAFINVYCEVRFHVTAVTEVAAKMNYEMKLIMPSMSVALTTLVMVCGANHCDQSAIDITIKVLIIVGTLAYVVLCEFRTKEALNKKKEEEAIRNKL